MTLPELVRKSAEKLLARFCAERIPPCAQDQVRLGFHLRGDQITLYEERPSPQDPSTWLATDVAQFRYSHDLGQWTLHYPDRQRRWRLYLNAGPSLDLRKLLHHLDADPLHHFWG